MPVYADDGSLVYGDGPEASLLAGIVGHNLCIDRFEVHGLAKRGPCMVKRVVSGGPQALRLDSCCFQATLPQAGLHVKRRMRLSGHEVTLDTEVVSADGHVHEIEWAEHVTLGDPFLTDATITAPLDGAWLWPVEALDDARFTAAPGDPVDPLQALAMPRPDDPQAGDIVAGRVSHGWCRAVNSVAGWQLELRWDAHQFPWLCIWTEHCSRQDPPWRGHTRARGLEISTKPFPKASHPKNAVAHGKGGPRRVRSAHSRYGGVCLCAGRRTRQVEQISTGCSGPVVVYSTA